MSCTGVPAGERGGDTALRAIRDRATFGLTLRDGAGATSTILLADYGRITRPYRRTGVGIGTGWVNEYCTFRVPVRDLISDGATIDLSDVRTVRLEFGPPYGESPGRIGLDDVILTLD